MAIVNPYIRKIGDSTPTYRLIDDFGFYVKDIPFSLSAKVKEPEKNTFFDEDGDQEYEQNNLYLEGYEMEITFCSKGTKEQLYSRYMKLLKYLTGKDGTGTKFMLYNERIGAGRTDIRLKEFDDDAEYYDLDSDEEPFLLEIKSTFKVNDPITEVTLNADGTIQ